MGSTENVVDILVRRDRISKRDAVARVKECKRRLYEEAIPQGDYEAAEDIMADELGLEMDYIYQLL